LGLQLAQVNSLHHQAVRRLADGLTATATACDGVLEALELADYPFAWQCSGILSGCASTCACGRFSVPLFRRGRQEMAADAQLILCVFDSGVGGLSVLRAIRQQCRVKP